MRQIETGKGFRHQARRFFRKLRRRSGETGVYESLSTYPIIDQDLYDQIVKYREVLAKRSVFHPTLLDMLIELRNTGDVSPRGLASFLGSLVGELEAEETRDGVGVDGKPDTNAQLEQKLTSCGYTLQTFDSLDKAASIEGLDDSNRKTLVAVLGMYLEHRNQDGVLRTRLNRMNGMEERLQDPVTEFSLIDEENPNMEDPKGIVVAISTASINLVENIVSRFSLPT